MIEKKMCHFQILTYITMILPKMYHGTMKILTKVRTFILNDETNNECL